MKKILAFLPLIAVLGLAGCGGDKDGDEGEGQKLEITKEQAEQKMRTLATEEGYEISFTTTEDGQESETTTIGMKGAYFWSESNGSKEMAYAEENAYTPFEWDSEANMFKKGTKIEVEGAYDLLVNVATANFYMANAYDGLDGFKKVKDLTYVGRSATEYKFHQNAYGLAVVDIDLIIDKATGITLYWDASGHNYEGEGGQAGYKVTSFKTGAQVVVPDHD